MGTLTWAGVARYRRTLVGSHRVRTKAQALRFVEALGFCYAFTPGPGDLPALFDVLDTRSVNRMWAWVWQWKDELATERKLFYGRLLRRKPTFVSLAYLPHFFALTGNVGEADDYLQAYREGRLGRLAKEVYEYVREHGRCSTWTLRRQFVLHADRAAPFHRALRALQERCLIAKVAEQENGSFAYIWDAFDRWLPEVVRAAERISSTDAAAVGVAVAADHDRLPAQLRPPQLLDRGEEGVDVDVQDRAGHHRARLRPAAANTCAWASTGLPPMFVSSTCASAARRAASNMAGGHAKRSRAVRAGAAPTVRR